jgi:cellulose synthase/poly-beta-1,6-N-acetylglucosamine synthase-like glycosyltransferase
MKFLKLKMVCEYIKTRKYDSRLYSVGYVSGAHMTIDADFLREHGLFDESYFFGMEDVEICYRATKKDIGSSLIRRFMWSTQAVSLLLPPRSIIIIKHAIDCSLDSITYPHFC